MLQHVKMHIFDTANHAVFFYGINNIIKYVSKIESAIYDSHSEL